MFNLGPGITLLSNKKYLVKSGPKVLGEFNTLKEAATAYNNHVGKVFFSPVYNKNGTIYEGVEDIKSGSTEEPTKEWNAPLKKYLAEKEAERIEEENQNNIEIITEVEDEIL